MTEDVGATMKHKGLGAERMQTEQDYLEALPYLSPNERAELDALLSSDPNEQVAIIAEPTFSERSYARLFVASEARNADVLHSYCPAPDLTVNACAAALSDAANKIEQGDLGALERTLATQAATLDTIFTNLALRASRTNDFDVFERYLRLAFRAQSQSRSTIEALAEIKNPRTVSFVRQANVGQNVQVNNRKPRASKKRIQKTELLEAGDGERLDAGTADSTIEAHSRMEAVATLDGTAKRRR